MKDKNGAYPKKIITMEKILEDSTESYEVETVVNNEDEEDAVNTAVEYMASFNRRDPDGCDKTLNFPHARLGMNTNEVIITEKSPQIPPSFFDWFTKNYGWNHSCWDYRKIIQSSPNKIHLQIILTSCCVICVW